MAAASTLACAGAVGRVRAGEPVHSSATPALERKDETQPEYWLEKLDDASLRARAVRRLEQFFEDAYTRGNTELGAPEVQRFIDLSVEPLTRTYVQASDTMDPKARVSLIKLLSAYRDQRAVPAFKKAFEEFAKVPKAGSADQDIKWAAIAAGDLKSETLAGPMLEAFSMFRANTMLGGVAYKQYHRAMLKAPSRSWVEPLIAKLDVQVTRPQGRADRVAVENYMDQMFWQVTAAGVLGELRDARAVEPLIRVVLDPDKLDFHETAVVSLLQLGKPASAAAIGLLQGTNERLRDHCIERLRRASGAEPGSTSCRQTAAVILGSIGHSNATGALIEVLAAEKDVATKAVIARELPKLPVSTASLAAFKAAYESLPLDARIPPDVWAIDVLTEAAGQFLDPNLVPWLLSYAARAKGAARDRRALQQAVTVTVIKLARPDQLGMVERAVNSYGTELERELFAQAEALLKECGDHADCYVEALQKSENQARERQFVGIKAGHMAAIFGDARTRDAILNRLDSIENPALRFTAAQAIDRLSPNGAPEAVEKIRAIVDKNAESPDRDKALGDTALKQVMHRLLARGG